MKPVETHLASARLVLTPVRPADLGELHALYTDPEVRRHLWDDLIVDQLDADNTIRQSLRAFRAHGYGLWRLDVRESVGLVGVCGLRETGVEAELVVAIDPRRQRQGYAREACLTVLGHALRTLRLPRVVGMCDVGNPASNALVRALGMREQHVTRVAGLGRTLEVALYESTLADLPPRVQLPATGSGR